MKFTQPTKAKDIKRSWHLLDANGKVLGRFAVEVASLLMGKKKSYFAYNLDCGDYVVVINSRRVVLTGKKETEKVYTRYSGYPGGLRRETVSKMRERKPETIIEHAVYGMLPKNKLRSRMMTRLYVSPDEKHNYQDRLKKT